MSEMIVVTREGERRELDAKDGMSVMEIVQDGGVDELLALCGGCCSCATCHVYVEALFGALPPMNEESDFLESSDQRTAHSPTFCQFLYSETLCNLTIEIAPED